MGDYIDDMKDKVPLNSAFATIDCNHDDPLTDDDVDDAPITYINDTWSFLVGY